MNSEKTPLNSTIALEPYRWLILLIFSSYCCANFFLIFQFSVIANITERYYNAGNLMNAASGLVFMLAYILFAVPIGRFMENHDLRWISIVSTGLTAFGNLLKFFALTPDRFYVILISQSICGVAQVFMMGLTPKVACIWFGPNEVSKACGIGIMGFQLGMALGCAIPTFLVPDSVDMKEVANGFFKLYTLDNAASMGLFILVLLFFRSEPEFPPSISQLKTRASRLQEKPSEEGTLKKYLTNKDFLLILYTFGTAWGLWNAIGFVTNESFLHVFPDIPNIIGLLLMGSILAGGVFGSLIFGYVLDKTHEFKRLSVFLLAMNCMCWSFVVYFLKIQYLIGACSFFIIAGFFGGSLAVTGFEYTTEVVYPLPEAYGTTILSCSIYFFTIVYTLLVELIFSTIGFFAGQMLITIAFGTTVLIGMFISSNFKRRNANVSGAICENSGLLK